MTIKPITEQYFPAIDALADSIRGNDADPEAKRLTGWSRRDFVAGGFKANPAIPRTLVAEKDGKLVGAGKISGNEDVPRKHLRLSVHPAYRRQGIGTALFQALTAEDWGPLFVREWHDDPTTVAFYKSLGTEGERCTEGWIYPDHPESGRIEDALASVPAHLKVLPIDDPNSPARLMDDAVVRAITWMPASPQSGDEALEFFLGDSLPDSLFCARVEDELFGAAASSKSMFGDPSSAYSGNTMLADTGAANAPAIAKALIAYCLNAALQKGLRVQVEQTNLNAAQRDCYHSIPGTDLKIRA